MEAHDVEIERFNSLKDAITYLKKIHTKYESCGIKVIDDTGFGGTGLFTAIEGKLMPVWSLSNKFNIS
jgi:hypothetical protein